MQVAASIPRQLVPLALVGGLFIVFLPLTPGLTDVLVALNLGFAVLVLVTCVAVRRPLEFNIFPALLLVTTLARLSLNIATTRMILTTGAVEGADAAGRIIQAFGEHIAGDSLVVGGIMFGILVIVQLIVVTQGAGRISEVAARFALDGLPGRQMTIDADLAAGLIDKHEARRQRQELVREAHFFGAMDGASKFLRGDAVAGVAITAINIVGGLYRGVVEAGLSWGEASAIYTKLTIGDGLASQLPGFLISIGAGLLIARCSESGSFSLDFLQQSVTRPEAIWIVSAFLGLLAVAGLPVWPLLLAGTAFLVLSRWVRSVPESEASAGPAGSPAPQPPNTSRTPDRGIVYDPLELDLGLHLLPLTRPQGGPDLLARIGGLRDRLLADVGLVLPRIRVRDNLRLDKDEFCLRMYGKEVVRGRLVMTRVLAVASTSLVPPVSGVPARGLVSHLPAWWIDAAQQGPAMAQGYRILPPADALLEALHGSLTRHADELLTRDAVSALLEAARRTVPTVVDELVPGILRLATLQQVLRQLVRERVSIRQLPRILEALCDQGGKVADPLQLTELIRIQLSGIITSTFCDREWQLRAARLSADLEQTLLEAVQSHVDPMVNHEMRGLIGNVCREIDRQTAFLKSAGATRILLVSQPLRPHFVRWTCQLIPDLIVLGDQEITKDAQIVHVATVGALAVAA